MFYGTPSHNSLTILNKYFTKYPEDAAKVTINIKGLVNHEKLQPEASREKVFEEVQQCLEWLPPSVKKIDLFEPARIDQTVPLEETFGALKECVEKGWIGGVAVSEAGAETIRKISKIVKIEQLETELGMLTRDALENGIATTCGELGIPIVA
jgi:pyridoxine 4-dehydrogenase